MKLRQVALAAEHLEPHRTQLLELLGIAADFSDPGVAEFGLVNSVMAIGDSYLEIVAPNQATTAAGRLLERRGQACGYMLLMQVGSYSDFSRHLDSQEVRKIWEVERSEVSACHVHPKDIGAAIVSFDEMRPPESWVWAGSSWRQNQAKHVKRILGCTVQTAAPDALAQRWGRVMQTAPQANGSGNRLAFADGTFVDFVPGEAYEGISAFTFSAENPDAIFARATSLGLEMNSDGRGVAIGGLQLNFTD